MKAHRQAGETNLMIRRRRIVVATSGNMAQPTGAQPEKTEDGGVSQNGSTGKPTVLGDGGTVLGLLVRACMT